MHSFTSHPNVVSNGQYYFSEIINIYLSRIFVHVIRSMEDVCKTHRAKQTKNNRKFNFFHAIANGLRSSGESDALGKYANIAYTCLKESKAQRARRNITEVIIIAKFILI